MHRSRSAPLLVDGAQKSVRKHTAARFFKWSLAVSVEALAFNTQVLKEHSGMLLADLHQESAIPSNLINITIARHDLYIELATYRLSEPWRTPVFSNQSANRAPFLGTSAG